MESLKEAVLPTLNVGVLKHEAIRRAILETKGSVHKAAKLLGMGRATLYRVLAKYPELRS